MINLNQFISVRNLLIAMKRSYLVRFWGMDIDPTAGFSLSARFDQTNPRGIHVGANAYLAYESAVLSHDALHNRHVDTWIGSGCFIGARSIILPGVRIGNGSVIGAGSIVASDIPANCIAAGNPARVVKTDIVLSEHHVLIEPGQLAASSEGSADGRRKKKADSEQARFMAPDDVEPRPSRCRQPEREV